MNGRQLARTHAALSVPDDAIASTGAPDALHLGIDRIRVESRPNWIACTGLSDDASATLRTPFRPALNLLRANPLPAKVPLPRHSRGTQW